MSDEPDSIPGGEEGGDPNDRVEGAEAQPGDRVDGPDPIPASPVFDETQPGYAPKTPEGLPSSGVVNTRNPALPEGTDIGTLENPKNTGSGDTPAPTTPGSAPGPEGAVELVGSGPQPKGGQGPTQGDSAPVPTESAVETNPPADKPANQKS